MNKLGIIVGRMQPLHNGHVALIHKALKENEQVLLLLGSVNREVNFNNPFTYDERVKMVRNVFPEEMYEELLIRGIKDKPTDDEWIQELIANIGQVEEDPSKVILYTSEKDAEWYKGSTLYHVETLDSKGLSATDIRNTWYTCEENLYKLVPDYVCMEMTKLTHGDRWLNLRTEKIMCLKGKEQAIADHKFSNPIEPVAHAALIHDKQILLVQRNSTRGYGQWALPGGFIEHTETTREAAVRELREETGVDLMEHRVQEMAQAVEENIDDLSVRTLGINYLYVMDPSVEKPEVSIDDTECLAYRWCPIADILSESMVLFYNHNVVVQRLLANVWSKS